MNKKLTLKSKLLSISPIASRKSSPNTAEDLKHKIPRLPTLPAEFRTDYQTNSPKESNSKRHTPNSLHKVEVPTRRRLRKDIEEDFLYYEESSDDEPSETRNLNIYDSE